MLRTTSSTLRDPRSGCSIAPLAISGKLNGMVPIRDCAGEGLEPGLQRDAVMVADPSKVVFVVRADRPVAPRATPASRSAQISRLSATRQT